MKCEMAVCWEVSQHCMCASAWWSCLIRRDGPPALVPCVHVWLERGVPGGQMRSDTPASRLGLCRPSCSWRSGGSFRSILAHVAALRHPTFFLVFCNFFFWEKCEYCLMFVLGCVLTKTCFVPFPPSSLVRSHRHVIVRKLEDLSDTHAQYLPGMGWNPCPTASE